MWKLNLNEEEKWIQIYLSLGRGLKVSELSFERTTRWNFSFQTWPETGKTKRIVVFFLKKKLHTAHTHTQHTKSPPQCAHIGFKLSFQGELLVFRFVDIALQAFRTVLLAEICQYWTQNFFLKRIVFCVCIPWTHSVGFEVLTFASRRWIWFPKHSEKQIKWKTKKIYLETPQNIPQRSDPARILPLAIEPLLCSSLPNWLWALYFSEIGGKKREKEK